jgi:glycogen(starch) synthase
VLGLLAWISFSSNPSQAAVEVEEMEPTSPEIAKTMQAMKDRGIGMLYGRWLIEGAPRVLLIDTKTAYGYMNEWKTDLWNIASIPSPSTDDETNEAIVFGYLVAWFLGEVSSMRLCASAETADRS